jgi:hypothetical protein
VVPGGEPGVLLLPERSSTCPVPIDESIMILVTALVFGSYIIYRNNIKQKTQSRLGFFVL